MDECDMVYPKTSQDSHTQTKEPEDGIMGMKLLETHVVFVDVHGGFVKIDYIFEETHVGEDHNTRPFKQNIISAEEK